MSHPPSELTSKPNNSLRLLPSSRGFLACLVSPVRLEEGADIFLGYELYGVVYQVTKLFINRLTFHWETVAVILAREPKSAEKVYLCAIFLAT
jgi:hypothetical protein